MLVVAGLSLLVGGIVGLIANNQSIALFYFLRNFLSDDSVSQHDNLYRQLPSLDIFDKENRTGKNAEGIVKQINLASGAMIGFSLAAAAVYFALVITAFTARAVFYRGIYQGLGRLVMSPKEPTATEELENFREYLIGNNLNETLDKDVLDHYRQDKKGFMSAFWQDITRAFRLGTKSASEKTVQCVIEDVKNKTVKNPSALYQAFQTLEATNLTWKEEQLTYDGESDDLKDYFTKSNLTLDRLGVENGEAKKPEIARTLKKIGLFAKGSAPAGGASSSLDPAVSVIPA